MRCLIIDDNQSCIDELKNQLCRSFLHIQIDVFHEVPETEMKNIDIIFLKAEWQMKSSDDAVTVVITGDEYPGVETETSFLLRRNHITEDFQEFYISYIKNRQNKMKIIFHLNQKISQQSRKEIELTANDIVYVECFAHELIVHTYKNEYVVKMTLKSFFAEVNELRCFIQVHRTYAVNMNYIYRIDNQDVHMINDDSKNEIRISQKYKKQFLRTFHEYMMKY